MIWGLSGGLTPNIEKSDVYANTGHPCRLDFERFGKQIGIVDIRIQRILDKYVNLPQQTETLVSHSYLNEKMKRNYLRIVNERIRRFIRESE
jgi:serine/threonine-protein kinase HipA